MLHENQIMVLKQNSFIILQISHNLVFCGQIFFLDTIILILEILDSSMIYVLEHLQSNYEQSRPLSKTAVSLCFNLKY